MTTYDRWIGFIEYSMILLIMGHVLAWKVVDAAVPVVSVVFAGLAAWNACYWLREDR